MDVVLEGIAEQVKSEAELKPIAEAFARKYGTKTWDFVVSRLTRVRPKNLPGAENASV